MKKLMCLVVMLKISIIMLGQATDLVVTTEREGQLSELITGADQATVKNLKVIGNINSIDLKFIGSLINKKLRGTIDLYDAIIKQMNGHNPFNMPLLEGGEYTIVKKLLLPKSLESLSGDYWFSSYLRFDSLVFDTRIKTITGHAFVRCAKHLVLGENVDSIKGPIINYSVSPWSCETIELKSYPKYLDRFIYDETNSFVLSHDNAEHLVNVEHIGHSAFGGSTDSYGETCNKRVLSEIDTLCFPNIRTFYFTAFTYRPGVHIYLGKNLQQVYFNNNPTYYSADGVTFHIAANTPPTRDYGFSWMKGNYRIMVPKESVSDYIENNWPNIYAEPVPLTAIDIKPTNVVMEVGETMQLVATPIPANADDVVFAWESSNEEVVKVSDTEVITAIKSGEVQITVSSKDGQIKSTVKIVVATHVTGVVLSQENCQLNDLGESVQLEATVLPENATNKDVSWTSSNELVCVVVNGKVIATGFGVAVVKATSVDGGHTAICIVKVVQGVKSVALSSHELNMKRGDTAQLLVNVLPDNAYDKTVKWTSSNDSLATVDADGNVKALVEGEVFIKATSSVNDEVSDSCRVNIVRRIDVSDSAIVWNDTMFVYTGLSPQPTWKNAQEEYTVTVEIPELEKNVGRWETTVPFAFTDGVDTLIVNVPLCYTITPALLIVKPQDAERYVGEENPEFTIIYEGFVNKETEDVLTKKATAYTEATKESPIGQYPIYATGAETPNYELVYENGVLTVKDVSAITDILASGQLFDIYTISGLKVRQLQSLPKGIYVVNGRKLIVK